MQIRISARHGHISATTQDKISEKVRKLLKYFDRLKAAEVLIDLEHREAVEVEVRLSVEHAPDFVASETSEELFVALDEVVHKLEQQLRKHKEKLQTVHRQPGRKQLEVPLEPESGTD